MAIVPTVCGSQPFDSLKEAVALETPPYTDAVKGNFHLFRLLSCHCNPQHGCVNSVKCYKVG